VTYHAAVFGLEHLSVPTNPDPCITCDGCGVRKAALSCRLGKPESWLVNNKAPKGWVLERTEEPFTRRDFCPACRPKKRRAKR
jgi:hypothetical protein